MRSILENNLTSFNRVGSATSASASKLQTVVVYHNSATTAKPLNETLIERRRSPRLNAHGWVYATILGDALLISLATMLAFWLRFRSSYFVRFDVITARQYFGYFVLGTTSQLLTLAWLGLYNRSVLLRSKWVAARMSKGVLMWTAGFLAITLALALQPSISRVYVALNGVCTLLLLLGWRKVLGLVLRRPALNAGLRQRTLFIGWSEDAGKFLEALGKGATHAYDVVGWLDLGQKLSHSAQESSPKRLGDTTYLEQIIARENVDMVILADMNGPRDSVVEIANLCEREMVSFKVIPSCFQIFSSGLHLEMIAGTPILGVDRLPLDSSLNLALKRVFDIVGGLAGLVVFSPVIAFFCAMVRHESRGPVFYRQRRTGLDGQPFEILKIRSMQLDAEANGKVGWSTQQDPRRLRVGSFMRKWNIDELPQFWNVIKGEMSLVGPRPERPELIHSFKHEIPHYNARHHARPGMTGWAQIKGLRGDTDLCARIRCDLWYLENWNLALDLQIMLLTFFKRKNAF